MADPGSEAPSTPRNRTPKPCNWGVEHIAVLDQAIVEVQVEMMMKGMLTYEQVIETLDYKFRNTKKAIWMVKKELQKIEEKEQLESLPVPPFKHPPLPWLSLLLINYLETVGPSNNVV